MNKLNKELWFLVICLFCIFDCDAFANNPIAEQNFIDAILELPKDENAIIVEKKSQTLSLYTIKSQKLFLIFKVSCSTGELKGRKQKAGDKKTPEGIYFLNDEFEDKYLSPIYGKKAFPIDYPNIIDKTAGKNGSSIWIHGTNKKLIPLDSNGCIALENKNILNLSNYININSTPVIIVQTIGMLLKTQLEKQKKDITSMLSKWTTAIETGSYQDYLSFYSHNYLPEISWWQEWRKLRENKNYRKITEKTTTAFKIEIARTGIYYHDKIYVALFDYYLVLGNKNTLLGKRKLFLEFDQNYNTYKIIGDVFQKKSKKFKNEKQPLIKAATTFMQPDQKLLVIKTIKQWLAAWSAKDMNRYAMFYADNFYSDGLNKATWVKRKQKLAKKYSFIHISGQNFKVKLQKQMCEVVFVQKYESSGFATQGTKKLKLVNKGGLWKIYQESWREK